MKNEELILQKWIETIEYEKKLDFKGAINGDYWKGDQFELKIDKQGRWYAIFDLEIWVTHIFENDWHSEVNAWRPLGWTEIHEVDVNDLMIYDSKEDEVYHVEDVKILEQFKLKIQELLIV